MKKNNQESIKEIINAFETILGANNLVHLEVFGNSRTQIIDLEDLIDNSEFYLFMLESQKKNNSEFYYRYKRCINNFKKTLMKNITLSGSNTQQIAIKLADKQFYDQNSSLSQQQEAIDFIHSLGLDNRCREMEIELRNQTALQPLF